MLYQLITGHRPCGATALTDSDLMRAICDEPPMRPILAARSGTGFHVGAELEWVVLKAIRKEPDRRYESVQQFADDIGRLLTAKPVLAGPDSHRYRAHKFMRRHWVGVSAAAAVIIALAAGATTTWWQAQRANRRFNDVRQLAHTFIFDIHDEVEKLPGSTTARKLLVTNALRYLDSLSTEAGA